MDPCLLHDYLVIITALLWAPNKGRFKSETGVQGLNLGSSRLLAKRLSHVADDVEMVNNDPCFRPNAFRRTERGYILGNPFGELPHRFRALPKLLRDYGTYVARQSAEIGRFRKGPGRGKPVLKNHILFLLRAVQQTTGRSHYRELADLLSISTEAISTKSMNFNEGSLRQLAARARRNRLRQAAIYLRPWIA